ncbi:MAG: Gfo/Idh/MocA family oxidoreductase [Akkermansiaceae bacterium]|jgi:predicted dehydrogenase|nr:Gfo/Idh/MocA family oxidoreductase [Akkermansiaceae bacterium]
MNARPTRRSFLKTAAAFGMPAIIPGSALGLNGAVAPSNRITVGAIGIGPRGRLVLSTFLKQPEAQVVMVCDVQKANRRTGKLMVDRAYKNEDCAVSSDLLEMLAREDIDAVMIATGDRWHGVGSILAAKAGKDIYSEKPCAITMAESREIDEAVKLYGRVFQAGTQRRTVPNFMHAVELARSGRLGKLQTLHASINPLQEVFEWKEGQAEPPAEEVDWDRWLGPVPWRPYHQEYVRGGWRGHHDFDAGGRLLDWGCHTVDLCQWAAGMDGTAPVEYEPDGQTIRARYADGKKLVMRLGGFNNEGDWLGLGTCPVRFEGEDGWVETGDFGKMAANPASLLADSKVPESAGTDPGAHVREFLECVKTRGLTSCNSGAMRSSHVACHAAAIAVRLGRRLVFDPATESFPDDAEANRLRSRARRAPWHA